MRVWRDCSAISLVRVMPEVDGAAALAALRAIAPVELTCAGGALDPIPGLLYPEEEAYIASARIKRRREFIAGRYYARLALAQLAAPAQAIPVGASRAPRWPTGTLGSITHTDTLCLAVAARSSELLSVGLDVEPDAPLDQELWQLVLTPDERAELGRMQNYCHSLSKLVFVAKEAVYKMYHPLTGHFLDFQDVTVSFDIEHGQFIACVRPACPPIGAKRHFAGRFARAGGALLALATLAHT
jgi:4'-phosphopantetheinyl transferase EntD